MKKTFVNMLKLDAYITATTKNAENFPAWDLSDDSLIQQLCMVGVTGNTFYADEKKLIKESLFILDRVAKEKPDILANALVKGRNEGFVRTINILGLVYLSKYYPDKFKAIFSDIVQTGNDLGDFLDLCHSLRGFGRSVKSSIHKWLRNVSEFYAIKYKNQIKDAIRISRYASESPIIDWIMDKEKPIEPDINKQIACYESAMILIINGDWEKAIEQIEIGRLDFATLISYGDPTPKAWKTLTKQMGIMALLKYLNKLDRMGVWDDQNMKSWLKERFTVDALKKAKIFPFRLYIAYKNVSNQFVSNLLADVLDEYVKKYDWNKWNGRFVIAPDISGSMVQKVGSSDLTPATIAGMFSGILYKGIPDSQIIPWGTEIHLHKVPKRDSVISHIKAIETASGGGTYMEIPVNYMREKNIPCDYFIIVTDSQEWGSGWLDVWKKYHSKYPNSKAIMIRVDPYPTQPFPDSQAKEYNIYQIFGWNDNVIGYIDQCIL